MRLVLVLLGLGVGVGFSLACGLAQPDDDRSLEGGAADGSEVDAGPVDTGSGVDAGFDADVSYSKHCGTATSYLSARASGAVGDGVADDTNALNQLLLVAQKRAASSGGRVAVYLDPGIYRVTDSIFVRGGDTGVTLCGAGDAASIVRFAGDPAMPTCTCRPDDPTTWHDETFPPLPESPSASDLAAEATDACQPDVRSLYGVDLPTGHTAPVSGLVTIVGNNVTLRDFQVDTNARCSGRKTANQFGALSVVERNKLRRIQPKIDGISVAPSRVRDASGTIVNVPLAVSTNHTLIHGVRIFDTAGTAVVGASRHASNALVVEYTRVTTTFKVRHDAWAAYSSLPESTYWNAYVPGVAADQGIVPFTGDRILVHHCQVDSALDDALGVHGGQRVAFAFNRVTTTGGRLILSTVKHAVAYCNSIKYVAQNGGAAIAVTHEPYDPATTTTDTWVVENRICAPHAAPLEVSAGIDLFGAGTCAHVVNNRISIGAPLHAKKNVVGILLRDVPDENDAGTYTAGDGLYLQGNSVSMLDLDWNDLNANGDFSASDEDPLTTYGIREAPTATAYCHVTATGNTFQRSEYGIAASPSVIPVSATAQCGSDAGSCRAEYLTRTSGPVCAPGGAAPTCPDNAPTDWIASLAAELGVAAPDLTTCPLSDPCGP